MQECDDFFFFYKPNRKRQKWKRDTREEEDTNRLQHCVYGDACVIVCLCVHSGGREEWKEFPALVCVGVRILEEGSGSLVAMA